MCLLVIFQLHAHNSTVRGNKTEVVCPRKWLQSQRQYVIGEEVCSKLTILLLHTVEHSIRKEITISQPLIKNHWSINKQN